LTPTRYPSFPLLLTLFPYPPRVVVCRCSKLMPEAGFEVDGDVKTLGAPSKGRAHAAAHVRETPRAPCDN